MTSTNGGATWAPAARGGGVWLATHGALFAGTSGGVWALQPGGEPGGGGFICLSEPIAGFGRIWHTFADARQATGCPLEPERSVTIRYRPQVPAVAADPFAPFENGPRDLYWTEDDDPRWHAVGLDASGQYFDWVYGKSGDRSGVSWPPGQDIRVTGAAERFQEGLMLWLPVPDGTRRIIVLPRAFRPLIYPD